MKKTSLFFILSILLFGIFNLQSILDLWTNFNIKRNLVNIFMMSKSDEFLIYIPCFNKNKIDNNENELKNLAYQISIKPDLKSIDHLHRGLIFCLLGQNEEALNSYKEGANIGDGWQALQAYYLFSEKGEHENAQRILASSHVGLYEANNFFWTIRRNSIDFNIIGLASYLIQEYEDEEMSWNLFFYSCDYFRVSKLSDSHNLTIDCYDQIINSTNRLSDEKLSFVYMYRGNEMRNLYPQYSPKDVIKYYEKSLAIDPNNHYAYLGLSNVYLWDLNDLENGKVYLDEALLVNPYSAHAYLNLGDYYKKLGDLPSAISAYEKSLLLRPGWLPAKERIKILQNN